MSRCDLVARPFAGKQKDLGLICFGSPFSSKSVVYGHCLVTLPTQDVSQLPAFMQSQSGGDIVASR